MVKGQEQFSRRGLIKGAAIGVGLGSAMLMVRNPVFSQELQPPENYHKFTYVFAAGLLGQSFPIEDIPKYSEDLGFEGLDIWKNITPPMVSAFTNYGMAKYEQLLEKHNQSRKVYSWYSTAPENLGPAIDEVKSLGGEMIVTGSYATHGVPDSSNMYTFVRDYYKRVESVIKKAEDNGITIAIENYSPGWMRTPEAVKEFLNQCPSDNYGLCFAPWHLPQDGGVLADIIRNSDASKIQIFYMWQKMDSWGVNFPTTAEGIVEYRKQLPSYGPLNFDPIIQALVDTDYQGLTEIFAHTYKHNSVGVDGPDTLKSIETSRDYLEDLLQAYNVKKFGVSVSEFAFGGSFVLNNTVFPLQSSGAEFQILNAQGQTLHRGKVGRGEKQELRLPRGQYTVRYFDNGKVRNRIF